MLIKLKIFKKITTKVSGDRWFRRTAYYCYKFGIKNYTLVDLIIPRMSNKLLSRVLNEENIMDQIELKIKMLKIL